MNFLRQKAELEASLNIVQQESKIAVTETEAKILEGANEEELDLPSEHVDRQESVKRYVRNLDINQNTNIPNEYTSSMRNVTAPSVPNMPLQSDFQPVSITPTCYLTYPS